MKKVFLPVLASALVGILICQIYTRPKHSKFLVLLSKK